MVVARRWCRRPGQLLLLLSMSLLHLLRLLLVLLLHLLSTSSIGLLLRGPLMVLLLLLRQFLMVSLLLGVELLLLLLSIPVGLRVSSVWSHGRLMGRKVLRMDRSWGLWNLVFWVRRRGVLRMRSWSGCPFRRARGRTVGGRWLSYRVIGGCRFGGSSSCGRLSGVIARRRLSSAIRGRMIGRSRGFGRYDSGTAE